MDDAENLSIYLHKRLCSAIDPSHLFFFLTKKEAHNVRPKFHEIGSIGIHLEVNSKRNIRQKTEKLMLERKSTCPVYLFVCVFLLSVHFFIHTWKIVCKIRWQKNQENEFIGIAMQQPLCFEWSLPESKEKDKQSSKTPACVDNASMKVIVKKMNRFFWSLHRD